MTDGDPPKILMVAYACDPAGGGEHWLGWGWAEQAARFCRVHLITTPKARSAVESAAARAGITPHFVAPPPGSRWGRKLKWQAHVTRCAGELHAREKFALVHQTTFHSFRVPFGATALGVKSVWGPVAGGEAVPPGFGRDLGAARFAEMGRRWINRLWLAHPAVQQSLARADCLFVSNRTTLNFLPEAARPKCVVVPPNALRPEDERHDPPALRRDSSTFQLLYVGNCVATRALPLVFQALRQVRSAGLKLTVVGAGPAWAGWKRLAAKWNLTAQVTFTGQVTRDQLPALYSGADALVFPALRDSGGSALLEAMARGVPVITLDWAGPGEMVDGSSGVRIPVRDREETVAALGAAIERLRALPELRLALAQAARERALANFGWDAKGNLLRSTYGRLLAGS